MSFNVTTVRDVVKPLQFVEEGTTAVTFGVPPVSAAFIAAGINTEISLDPRVVSETIRALGLEDWADSVKTQESYAFTLRSNLLNTILPKYGVNAVGGTGTIGASLLFAYSKYIDGVQYYTLMKGCRPISTTLTLNRGLWSLDQTFSAKSIDKEILTADGGLTTPTWVTSIPAGSPLKHQDATNVFSWGGTVFPERSFSTTVTRDLAMLDINGEVQTLFTKAAIRDIAWSIETYKKAVTIKDDYHDQTERGMVYKIGAAGTLTYTDAVITSYGERLIGGDSSALIESISGNARTLVLA